MAQYTAWTRTNYFAVTDEDKFREIMAACVSSEEDELTIIESKESPNKVGFLCGGTILGIRDGEDSDDGEYDDTAFHAAIQSVLADGDAIIITEVGHELMRYLYGHVTVITKHDIKAVNLYSKGIELARTMLNNPEFTTQAEY
jgi:hypothetical protein